MYFFACKNIQHSMSSLQPDINITMKKKIKTPIAKSLILCVLLGVFSLVVIGWVKNKDPLPSWNDGYIKQKIIRFVEEVSNPKSRNFVPQRDRIAVVDLDGTLIVEYPINFQRSLAIKRLKEKVREDMTLQHLQPFKSAWEDDHEFYNHKDNHSYVFLEAFKGYTQKNYDAYVRDYLRSHKPEYWGRSFQELFYVPGIELVKYLEKKGFHVYVCSTTEEVCIRILLEEVLGLEPRRVMGNEVDLEMKVDEDNVHFVMQGLLRIRKTESKVSVSIATTRLDSSQYLLLGIAWVIMNC